MKNSENLVRALLVGDYENDRGLLRDVFQQSGWRLYETADTRTLMPNIKRHGVQVVVAQKEGWHRILGDLQQLSDAPSLVVTSRTADDYLWAEVLNHGGFDVLAQPFDREELTRVLEAAGRHFHSHRQNSMASSRAASAA